MKNNNDKKKPEIKVNSVSMEDDTKWIITKYNLWPVLSKQVSNNTL